MASNYDRRSSSSASRPSAGAESPYTSALEDASGRRPPARRRGYDPRKESYYRRMRMLVASVVVLALVLIAYVVVVHSPLFEIKRITANPTQHVTSEQISALAAVPGGSTLFNVDEEGIARRLSENPWIASVSLTRKLPDELVVEVRERHGAAVVMLANGGEAWRIASDGYWLEQVALQQATSDNGIAAPADQARAIAASEGLVYVADVSALIVPEAGKQCADEAVLGVLAYLEGFSETLRAQVAIAKAPSLASISIVLANGVEVSLGAPADISLKEQIVTGLLDRHAGEITYINVRTPSSPAWRGLPDEPDVDASSDEGAQDSGADTSSTSELVGGEEGGPGGALDEGGYYSDSGHWIYAYHDADGNWINGFYEDDGSWVALS